MNVNRSFSHDKDWNCYDDLIKEYPVAIQRSIGSKIIREAIELFAKTKKSKSLVTMDDYGNAPRLDLEQKEWKKILKAMSITDVRDLQKLLGKRKGLVDDEVYKRTQ
jgi:hypothetical protein